MAELQERDTKLIQYLNEAYGKEKELETALQAHIEMTTRDSYKKRLKDHLKETKAQSKNLERRIKALGGPKAVAVPVPGPDVVSDAAGAAATIANKAVAAAKGQLHAVRGTGEEEKMLKNAKTEFWNEHEEIANYNAIETLAVLLGDKETAKLARDHRREEERMAKFLEKTIPQLTKEVAKAEIPAGQRNGGRRTRKSSASRSRATSTRAASASAGARKTTTAAKGSTRAGASKAKATTRASASKAKAKTRASASKAKATTRASTSKATASKGTKRASASRSTGSKAKGTGSRAKATGRTRTTAGRGRSK